MFELEIERYGVITVVHLTGDMLLEDAVSLRQQLEQTLKATQVKDVALDLHKVQNVDSSGLGALVGASATGRVRGKRLMLFQPSKEVSDLLEKVEIAGFFPLLEDEDDLLSRLPQ